MREATATEDSTDGRGHERLDAIVRLARDQQAAILPKRQPRLDGYDVFGCTEPWAEVGGDYYDFFPMRWDNLGMVLADAKGSGFSAAVQVTALKRVFKVLVETDIKTAMKFEILNRAFHDCRPERAPDYVTAVFVELEPDGRLYYVNAGHPFPLLIRDGGLVELGDGGLPIGMFPQTRYRLGIERLHEDDLLVMFTDGLLEARGATGEEFGMQRIAQEVLRLRAGGAEDVARGLLEQVDRHTGGADPSDDRSLIVVKRVRG